MRELDALEKAIVRAWSKAVAGGLLGTTDEVVTTLRVEGNTVDYHDVAKRITVLRAIKQLPTFGVVS